MVCVDWLASYGWKLYGRYVESCHLMSDINDKKELDDFALKIKLKKSYLQKSSMGIYHYDLVKSKRELAVKNGAKELDKIGFLAICTLARNNKIKTI